MKHRHLGHHAYIQATFRWMRAKNRDHFSAQEVLDIYSILAPKAERMTIAEISMLMHSYAHTFGITKETTETHYTATGKHPIAIWTWR